MWTGGDIIYCTDMYIDPGDTLCGRRPQGLRTVRTQRSTAAKLAQAAHLEAASVLAFEILHAELVAHRAPRSLQRAALRARRDEQRHARVTARLARRRGARPVPPSCAPHSGRDLLAVAIENVIEGCVRETYGAAVALWQAEHACARDVRAVMRSIANDEVRHADLGWRVADWVSPKLDVCGRAAVREAGRRAVRELWGDAASPANDELGLPDTHVARTILRQLAVELWEPSFGVCYARPCSSAL
jgi:rubrerythrin